LIGTQTISNSHDIEFILGLKETREFRLEVQIRIFDEQNNEVFRSEIDNSISSLNVNKATRFVEKTTFKIPSLDYQRVIGFQHPNF